MRFTCRLLLLVVLGILCSPAIVTAQSEESIILLSADDVGVGNEMFQKTYGARLLPLATRYHAGDNPAWADPAFDDRNWETEVDPWLPTAHLPQQGWPGIGWFRFRVRMEAPLQSQMLGFTIYHWGAVEVYVDGRLVYQSGTVGASQDAEDPSLDVSPFTLPLEAGREHVVALRYSSAHMFDTVVARWLGGSGLKLYWGDRATMQHHQSLTRLNEGLYVGFFLAFSLLFGLLFVLYREERLFLYCALLYGCWVPAVLILSAHPFMQGGVFFIPLWSIWSALVLGGSLALLRLLYAFFYPVMPRLFYGYLIAGLVTLTVVTLHYENAAYIALYFVPLFAELLRIIVVALWRRKRWAWVVGLGFLPIIVLGSLDMVNELGWLTAPWAGTAFEPGLVVMFILSASLAIYVGMRFADANRGLAQANRELTEANRTLEERVEERTAKLRASQAQLIQSKKMASLGQLTAGIAHEIKNPLNFVNNFAQLSVDLADELADELDTSTDKRVAEIRDDLGEILDDLKQNALKINKHGRRADGIVKSMLEHARSTPGERSSTDLNALLDEYVNLAYHGMRVRLQDFHCTIERQYDETVSTLELVAQELGRVILNVLNNAFEAVHEQTTQHPETYQPTVHVGTRQTNGNVMIQVRDNGPGIPSDLKEKIFEPFFTTKPTGQGTGLGLSLSYDIVTHGHGGRLTVESKEGQGATFIIMLPVNQPETAASNT